jgi:hypothetical protein
MANPPCASVERSRLMHVASFAILASPVVLVLLALIGADIWVLAALALAVGGLLILTGESLETKPHMLLFQVRRLRGRSRRS